MCPVSVRIFSVDRKIKADWLGGLLTHIGKKSGLAGVAQWIECLPMHGLRFLPNRLALDFCLAFLPLIPHQIAA